MHLTDVSFPRRWSDSPSSEGESGAEYGQVSAGNHKQEGTACADLVLDGDLGSETFVLVDGTPAKVTAVGGTGFDGERSAD